MRRRILLRAIGSASIVGIAECAGTGNGSTPTATALDDIPFDPAQVGAGPGVL
jgi:hypothetical protein